MQKIILTKAQEERAQELHNSSMFIDSLASSIVAPEPPERDGKSFLDRCLASGLTACNSTLAYTTHDFETALHVMYEYHNLFKYSPEKAMLIRTADDIETAFREKKLGVIFGFQSPVSIGSDFYKWTVMYEMGLRICSIAYNEPNILACGAQEPANSGLTFFGIQAVKEMNRQGILIDLSHVGERSCYETIELSSKPCIFTHTNPYGATPSKSKRNISDDLIKTLVKKGGIIGICPHGFLCHAEEGVQPTLEDYMDNFIYAADLVGTEYLCVGSDIYENYTKTYWENHTKLLYDSPWFFESVFNRDIKRVDQYINITRGLVAVGFNDNEIKDILGRNLMRLFRQVWKA